MPGELVGLSDEVGAWLQTPPAHGHANAGIVVEDDGLTLVDALLAPSQVEPLLGTLEALGQPIRRVVYTSSHIEFVGGSTALWMAARYGRSQTSALLDQEPNVAGYRRLFPEHAADFDDEFATRPVSHVVDEAAWLTPLALALPATGQQRENLVVRVPSAGVLFAGALCSFGVTPNCFDGDPEAWADQLDDLAGWGATIVPGIGPVGGPGDAAALQAYLYACVDAAGDPGRIPAGPWDAWAERDLDLVNVERAALLADGDPRVPPSMLARLGLT